MYYNAAMHSLKLLAMLLATLLVAIALALVGCARDTNDETLEDRYPLEVKLAFKTRGSLSPDTWYFIVFNFTSDSTAEADSPIDRISDEDRGDNWELYIALNTNTVGEDTLVTLQRPAVPTVLPVEEGPVDVVVEDVNQDTLMDIMVACREAGVILRMEGRVSQDTYAAIYFTDPSAIDTGPQPFRLFANQFSGEAPTDLLILYAGEDGRSPFLRVLDGSGTGSFAALEDAPLSSGIPVDALVADLNGDLILDLALVTTQEEGGDGELTIILRGTDGSFNETATYPLGPDPAQIAVGQLDESGLDLAVAVRGTAAQNGAVHIFYGAGDGTFTPRETPLEIQGTCTSVDLAQMLFNTGDTIDDVLVGYIDESGKGNLGVYINNVVPEGETPEDGEAFGELFLTTPTQILPYYIVAFDTGDDNHLDALVVDGAPGSGSSTFLIQRGLTEDEGGFSASTFIWDPEPITYPSGVETSRIFLGDIDQNGVFDVIAPNSANDEGGNSISLFYGLGKDNFTSADVFWVDQPPEPLILQDWYLSHTVGPNFFELTLDPGLFYDLARRAPTAFVFDFMTATTGIDIANNLDLNGEVIDSMQIPERVPMEIGYYNDEQNSQKVDTGTVAQPSEDLVDWRVEVL